MADKPAPTTTEFPKMGQNVAEQFIDVTAMPSRNTMPVRKAGNAKGGGTYPEPTAAHRTGIYERLGAKYAPQPVTRYLNAEQAAMVERNVYRVPSSVGNRDFYLRRRYGQGL